jgi:hypothetical protein
VSRRPIIFFFFRTLIRPEQVEECRPISWPPTPKLTEEKIGLRRHFGPAIDDRRLLPGDAGLRR